MAAAELLRSRRRKIGDSSSIDLIYGVQGTMDDDTVYSDVLAASPSTYLGYDRRSISIEAVDHNVWEGTVTYSDRSSSEPPPGVTETPRISFDILGQTARVFQARDQRGYIAGAQGRAPDFFGGIGWNGDAFEGADAIFPELSFAKSVLVDVSAVTTNYVKLLSGLVGKVNDANFFGFAKGEVLFIGASGDMRSATQYELSFRFAVSRNETNLKIGNITVDKKEGWELLWVCYRMKEDAAAKFTGPAPVAAYVATIYEEGDLSLIGIGGGSP